MIKFIRASCTIAVIFFAPFAVACDYPERSTIPNGSKATKDEMVAGQKGVKKYMADMEEYLACIDEEDKLDRAGIEKPDAIVMAQREEMLVKKHNAAVEDMEKVAARFNEEVRDYKDRKD
jgi:rhamnose utilization protein RhaD (predicted bifunctional aldolase and dehydrogenase)